MSGFGSAISFLFVFVIMSGMIVTAFMFLIEDTESKLAVLQENKEAIAEFGTTFVLESPSFVSGRLNLVVNNTGDEKLFFRDKNGVQCFNFFINDVYVKSDEFLMNILGKASVDYDFVDSRSTGTVTFTGNFNFSRENTVKAVSCNGKEVYLTIPVNSSSWFDEAWNYKLDVNVTNTANNSLSEYQIVIDLNSTNFDFNLGREEDFRIVMPVREGFKLDLPFDTYSQRLDDESNYDNNVTLGADPSAEATDPTQANGAILNSLAFDGVDDLVRVHLNDSLNINNSVSYAAWIKWNGSGDVLQHVISNGRNGSLTVVNDGGANDDTVLFNLSLDGVFRGVFSNVTLDNDWHFAVGTYDGGMMRLYVDSNLVGFLNTNGSIDSSRVDNYVGSNGSSYYFNGSLDEIKIVNFALNESEVLDLYQNNIGYRELDYHIASWDGTLDTARIYAKIPSIGVNESLGLEIYYNNLNGVNSTSDIEKTFSYTTARLIGYINNNRIADTIGLSIISLYDDNYVVIGDDSYILDEQDVVGNLDETDILITDPIYAKHLVNIEGNGGGVDIINPISWAGTDFVIGRAANNPDRFCINSPWGIANYTIYQVGALADSGAVGLNGTCRAGIDYGGSDNLYINSSIPVQVYNLGHTNSDRDTMPMHPMEAGTYYWGASARVDISAGPDPITALWFDSDGNTGTWSLAAYVDAALTGLGNEGDAPVLKVIANDPIGIIKETDSDGAEITGFLPDHQMGVRFGSNEAMDYVVAASPHADANCTMYDNGGTLDRNIPVGSGTNGVYNYSFGNMGTDNQYLAAGWMMVCDKPVNPHHEKTNNDETMLMGHVQMRQFVFPEPTVIIG